MHKLYGALGLVIFEDLHSSGFLESWSKCTGCVLGFCLSRNIVLRELSALCHKSLSHYTGVHETNLGLCMYSFLVEFAKTVNGRGMLPLNIRVGD